MTLNIKQVIVTEDLRSYSLSTWDPLVGYLPGDLVKDPVTSTIYKCISSTSPGDSLNDITKFQNVVQNNQSYDASTNTPDIAITPNGSELFVEVRGTRIISGISYDLNKGDLIKKSNSGTYTVIRGQVSPLHIEKNSSYTLLESDLPEDLIVGLHNTHTTNGITFSLPLGYTTDTTPDYVNPAGTTITIEAGKSVFVRNKNGQFLELVSYSTSKASGTGIAQTQKTVLASTNLTSSDKFSKVTTSNAVVTLPLLSSVSEGDIFSIKLENVFGCSVTPSGANTLDGSSSSVILSPFEFFQVRASVGLTDWEMI